jgi:hypothetical protein
MIKDLDLFKQSLKNILQSDDGLSIESEGTVYIRSLEGNNIVAGILDDDGGIERETEFNENIDDAIEYFISQRAKLNHGSAW